MKFESRACYLMNWRSEKQGNDTRGTTRNPRVRVPKMANQLNATWIVARVPMSLKVVL